MSAVIRHLEFCLPANVLENDSLSEISPDWTNQKIVEKTGIARRHIAAVDEFASDLAVNAAESLFRRCHVSPEQIDYVVYCTQSPDYILPSTACLIHQRLNLPRSAGAVDINLGCSGFVYGLGLAKGLIETGQSRQLLLLCADTYTKYLRPRDFALRTIFGDAGTACLVEATEGPESIGPFVYGTDGTGKENLIVRPGGFRGTAEHAGAAIEPALTMDGPEIFSFASQSVVATVQDLLQSANISLNDVDFWIFHQASQLLLDHLRKKLNIRPERFANYLRDYGNTVSCTIPIAMNLALQEKRIGPGSRIGLIGFGVGYSWGGCLVRWAG